METVYRRRRERNSSQDHHGETTHFFGYKQTVLKQSIFCLLIFILCLFVKVYPEDKLDVARNSLRLILNSQTDFARIPENFKNFVLTYILQNDIGNISDNEVLTNLKKPVDAPVTSPFGLRQHPTDGTEKFHYGVDLGAEANEKIKCVANGTAEEVGYSDDYGNYILVLHADEVYTLYAHCQEVLPKVGDSIESGQIIATVGATGNASGPHLHFEIRNGETYLNPEEFIHFEKGSTHD